MKAIAMSSYPEGHFVAVHESIVENMYLSGDEKLMLGIIFGLSFKYGYCDASNEYLSKRLGTTELSVQARLFRLKEKGLVLITDNSKKTRKRKITLPNLEKFSQYTKKTLEALEPSDEEQTTEGRFEKFVP
ncbi:MAG: helix-turn-helix domain-containing protein, partial [Clostridia bacterium]|nr:helix-turn-helix domain-containing protein [Clostridia bacterium]